MILRSDVHNSGFVTLVEHMGGDLAIVNSARVSFGKRKDTMGPEDVGLINFLMRERHGSPFEHALFRFHIRCPIFVAREWFRHRISSFNEYSQRYTEAIGEFYVPEADYVRTQYGKAGAYKFEPMQPAVAEWARDILEKQQRAAHLAYLELLKGGVAKEVARIVLPVGTYTEFHWTVNARSLMNFLSLRNAGPALIEIADYAVEVEKMASHCIPATMEAFLKNGRKAP